MRFHPLWFMYTRIFPSFNLFNQNKNWRIVNEERQIVYCVYIENFIVNETQFLSKYESIKREQIGIPYLKQRYSRPSLLLSCCCIALIQCAISPLMNVFYSVWWTWLKVLIVDWLVGNYGTRLVSRSTVWLYFPQREAGKHCYKFKSSPNFKSFVR